MLSGKGRREFREVLEMLYNLFWVLVTSYQDVHLSFAHFLLCVLILHLEGFSPTPALALQL